MSLHARLVKKLEFQFVLWPSESQVSLVQGHMLLDLLTILLEDDSPAHLPIGQVSFKTYLLSNKIYYSWTTRQDFSQTLYMYLYLQFPSHTSPPLE